MLLEGLKNENEKNETITPITISIPITRERFSYQNTD
jgi:hypothetical protein